MLSPPFLCQASSSLSPLLQRDSCSSSPKCYSFAYRDIHLLGQCSFRERHLEYPLVLCIHAWYLRLDLSIPEFASPHYKWWVQWLRKLKWLIIAVVAPEFVVYVAFLQWALAAKFLDSLREELKKHGKEDDGSYFSMTYAHFVLMGGFAVGTDHLHKVLQRATVTPRGMLLLASQGHFIYLSRDAIKGKSRASLLGKGLALHQILWLAGQVLERKIAALPITLLEIHTMPLDVVEPSIIQAGEFQDLIAYMLCVTRWKDRYVHGFKVDPAQGLSWDVPDEGLSGGCLFDWYGSLEQTPEVVENSTDKQPPWEEGLPKEEENAQVISYFQRKWRDITNETHNYIFLGIRYKWIPRSKKIKATLLSGQALSSGLGTQLQLKKQPVSRSAFLASTERTEEWIGDWASCYEISLSQQDLNRLDLAGTFIMQALQGSYPTRSQAGYEETAHHQPDTPSTPSNSPLSQTPPSSATANQTARAPSSGIPSRGCRTRDQTGW